MLKITRTDSDNPNFTELVKHLDADLAGRDGDEHAFYAQFNKTNKLKHVVVLYEDNNPAACGAIKGYSAVEVKRMYTRPEHRGKGLASMVLTELEKWAAEMFYKKCVLETGKRQPEAIALYTKNGYISIPNYGQYEGIENSRCFMKEL